MRYSYHGQAMETEMPVWQDNPDLFGRLERAQNRVENVGVDILTFAAFCDTREELEAHVIRYEGGADAKE